MAEGKRYYWLKLKEDFFDSKRIKKLRKIAGGDTYTIIYLKMQLKALRSEGIIEFTGLEEDFAAELALDLDEEPENVRVTLAYLLNCGLMETSDNINFFLPFVIDSTGSESASTQRSRAFRARQKALQCNADATDVQRIGNAEIEKELEIEKEKDITDSKKSVCRTGDVRRVKDAWNALGLGQITAITSDTVRGKNLKARINQNGVDKVLEAIERIKKSSFLQGQSKKGWIITFDWFVKPTNFLKVLEGNYDDHEEQTKEQRYQRSEYTL